MLYPCFLSFRFSRRLKSEETKNRKMLYLKYLPETKKKKNRFDPHNTGFPSTQRSIFTVHLTNEKLQLINASVVTLNQKVTVKPMAIRISLHLTVKRSTSKESVSTRSLDHREVAIQPFHLNSRSKQKIEESGSTSDQMYPW